MATLNRVVTLRIQSAGQYNEHGERTPGAIVDHVLWAEIANPEATNSLETDGNRDVRRKTFTIRWRRDAIDTPTNRLFVVDEYLREYNVEGASEIVDDTRKRFMTITGIRST